MTEEWAHIANPGVKEMQMINRRIYSAVAALVVLVAAAGSSSAFTITAGDIEFRFDSYDSVTVGYGITNGIKCTTVAACDAVPGITKAPGSIGSVNPSADTMGIVSVALILNTSTGQTLFTKGVDGFLTGVVGNLSDAFVEVNGCGGTTGCNTTALSLGGTFRVWQNATDYNPALGPLVGPGRDLNANFYPGINPGGSLYLSAVFSPGVLAGDFIHTYESNFNNNAFAGSGQGFLDLTGGSAFSTFNTNALTDANGNQHDLSLTVTFDDLNGAASNLGWTVIDPGLLKAKAVVPEPSSLVLLVLGGFVVRWASASRGIRQERQ